MPALWERALTAITLGVALAVFKVRSQLPEVIKEVANDEQKKARDAIRDAARSRFVRPSSGGTPRQDSSPRADGSGRHARMDAETRRVTRPDQDQSGSGLVDSGTTGGEQ